MNAIYAIVYFEAWKSQDFNCVNCGLKQSLKWNFIGLELKHQAWPCKNWKSQQLLRKEQLFLQYWKLYFNITKGTANYCCPDLLSYITTQERLLHGQHAQVNYPRNHKSTKPKLIYYSTKVMTQKIVQTTSLISCRIMSELLRSSWSAVPAYLC